MIGRLNTSTDKKSSKIWYLKEAREQNITVCWVAVRLWIIWMQAKWATEAPDPTLNRREKIITQDLIKPGVQWTSFKTKT